MNRLQNFGLTVEQAAARLKISPQRVRVLLAKGRLQGYQDVSLGGRVTWCVHFSLARSHGAAGRPRKKRRNAAAMNGGSEAKP